MSGNTMFNPPLPPPPPSSPKHPFFLSLSSRQERGKFVSQTYYVIGSLTPAFITTISGFEVFFDGAAAPALMLWSVEATVNENLLNPPIDTPILKINYFHGTKNTF